jgi:hypothetical protein
MADLAILSGHGRVALYGSELYQSVFVLSVAGTSALDYLVMIRYRYRTGIGSLRAHSNMIYCTLLSSIKRAMNLSVEQIVELVRT